MQNIQYAKTITISGTEKFYKEKDAARPFLLISISLYIFVSFIEKIENRSLDQTGQYFFPFSHVLSSAAK